VAGKVVSRERRKRPVSFFGVRAISKKTKLTMWMSCSITVTILHLLRVVLETLVGNLFGLKQNGSGQI
jgi:hypothetical protein